MPEAVILIGIQATGKSTFFLERFYKTHVRINLDMLRTRHREKRLIETCLEIGQSFVVDNTNPTVKDRERYLRRSKEKGFHTIGYYFQSKLAEAVERNSLRPEDEQISEKGIRGAYARLQLPSHSEGFDSLFYVGIGDNGLFKVEKWKEDEV